MQNHFPLDNVTDIGKRAQGAATQLNPQQTLVIMGKEPEL